MLIGTSFKCFFGRLLNVELVVIDKDTKIRSLKMRIDLMMLHINRMESPYVCKRMYPNLQT